MVSSMYCSLFIYLCNVGNYCFVMKDKDINSVNTYSAGPRLGYNALYLILVPNSFLIFKLRHFRISVGDNYLITILSDSQQSLSLGLTGGLGDVHQCLL